MTRSRLARELLFPLTDSAVLIAIVFFAAASIVVTHLGILGLWLAVLLTPVLYRYLLMVLEARALGRKAPVAGMETIDFIDNFWTLTPLILLALAVWGSFLLHRQVSPVAGQAFSALLIAVLPASLAVLAITRSPWESLNPRAVAAMVRACGPAYVLAPASIAAGVFVVAALRYAGAPFIVQSAAGLYGLFFLVTLMGGLLRENDVQLSISIPEPAAPDEASAAERRLQSRRQALTHAYGFFARDNRAGGLAHLCDALAGEGDEDSAWRWYLDEMFRWESKEAALVLSQVRLAALLGEGRDVEAVKLISRCLMADGRFRPLPDDREAVREVLRQLRRDDLLRALDL